MFVLQDDFLHPTLVGDAIISVHHYLYWKQSSFQQDDHDVILSRTFI